MSEKIETQEEHDIEDLEEMMEVIPFSKLELKIIERAIESLEKQVPKKNVGSYWTGKNRKENKQ